MFIKIDHSDPAVKGYKRFLRVTRNVLIISIAIALVVVFWGVPHIQWNYEAHDTGFRTPSATDKVRADYLSVFGWRQIHAGEYGPGCSVLVFVPLAHCTDISRFKNDVTTFLLSEEFFDEPTSR